MLDHRKFTTGDVNYLCLPNELELAIFRGVSGAASKPLEIRGIRFSSGVSRFL